VAVNLSGVLQNSLYNNPIDLYKHVVDHITDNHLTVSIDPEGWDLEYIGFYKFLDFVRQYLHPDLQVTIETSNIFQKHPPYVTLDYKTPGFIGNALSWWKPEYLQPKQIDKTFGLFVGRPDVPRLHFLSHLYSMYRDKSILTANCKNFQIGSAMHQQEAETIASNPALYDLIKILPISGPNNETVDFSSSIRNPINIPLYQRFFCEIVCETNFTQGFFPTEKIWRPILYKTPFIVVGAPGFINHLKALGFKTFDNYWNETYDDISPSPDALPWSWLEQKFNNIENIISMLACKNNAELQEMYDSMQDILDHNYNLITQNYPVHHIQGRLHDLSKSAKL